MTNVVQLPKPRLQTLPDGTRAFAHFAAPNAGQIIKDGPGVLAGISINTSAAGGSIALYDGLDDLGDMIGLWSSCNAHNFGSLNVALERGLFAVVTGDADVTVLFT